MKKHTPLYLMIMSALLLFVLFGCGYSPLIEPNSEDPRIDVEAATEGNLSITLNVLDYKNSAFGIEGTSSSRIIDPQSRYLEIVLDGISFTSVDLAAAGQKQTTSFGFQWTGSVDIPVPLAGSYATITLNFLDSMGNVLTTGTMVDVAVSKDAVIPVQMGCLPETYDELSLPSAENGLAVSGGATRYYALDMAERTTYTFDAVAAVGTDPDLYLFTEDGRPVEASTGSGNSESLQIINQTAGLYFIGVYAANALSDLSFSAAEINLLPVVVVGQDKTGDTDIVLSFSAAGTVDPEGGALTYAWDFGDDATAEGMAVDHQYGEAGVFSVTLTVTDEKGGSTEAELTAYIAQGNISPVADAGADVEIKRGDDVQLDASASYDPEGVDLRYSWDYDADGVEDSNEEQPVVDADFFTVSGSYDFVLTVYDDDATVPLEDTDTVTVNVVENLLPTAVAGNDQECALSETLSFSASGSSDVDDAFDTLAFSWDFGDGSAAVETVDASHTYQAPGTYTVVLTVTDPYGGSRQDTLSVVVKAAFVFNLTYEGENSFDTDHPIVLALVDYTTSGVAHITRADTDGQYTVYTSQVSRYNNAHQYILLLCHDMDNDVVGNWINGDLLGDAADFNGMYDGSEDGNVSYEVSAASLDLTHSEIATGSYDLVFTDQNGLINIIAQ